MRLFTAALLVGLCAYAQALLNARREAEERLLDIEQKYRRLVEQLPAVTYINPLSEADSSLYISPRVEDLLGYSVQESTEDPELWERLLHPEDRERVNAEEARTSASGEPLVGARTNAGRAPGRRARTRSGSVGESTGYRLGRVYRSSRHERPR